jgi:F0F1-type ATP synthase membrane subunit b/b'
MWKLKQPLTAYFTKLAEDITNTLERASLKSKEAEVMLAAQEKKMANLDQEMREIQRLTEIEVRNFEKNVARETEEKSFKLKADANAKIDAEKNAINDEMHAALLDEVISQTKATIRGNKDYQTKASGRMLGEIRA